MQDLKKALTISIFITPAITFGLFFIGIGLFGFGEIYNPVMQVVSKIMSFLAQPLFFIPDPVSLTRTSSVITLLLLKNYVFYTSLIYLFLILTKKNSMQ